MRDEVQELVDYLREEHGVDLSYDVAARLSAGYDILNDAGMVDEERLVLLVAVEARGDDVEAFARRLVRLSRSVPR